MIYKTLRTNSLNINKMRTYSTIDCSNLNTVNFQIQTELAYISNHKSELEEKMDDDELRQKREIIQLENEKVRRIFDKIKNIFKIY